MWLYLRAFVLLLAFVFYLLGEVVTLHNTKAAIFFYLTPTFLIFVWFAMSYFTRKLFVIPATVKQTAKYRYYSILRNVSSMLLLVGALFTIMHYAHARLIVLIGFGLLSVAAFFQAKFSKRVNKYNPDVIDHHIFEDNEE